MRPSRPKWEWLVPKSEPIQMVGGDAVSCNLQLT